ncbi:MAG: peptidase [Candidatus Glassbacteria bacterium]
MKIFVISLLIVILISCSREEKTSESESLTIDGLSLKKAEYVKGQLRKFSPTEITFDMTLLNDSQKMLLDKLIESARYMDEIFLRQVYDGNVKIRELLRMSSAPEIEPYLEYFMINFGPFDRLNEDVPFIGVESKPAGAAFYPEDITKEELEKWIEDHPKDRKAFESNFTVIRRDGDMLKAVPYSETYRDLLEPAASALREAADLTDNASLKKYLNSRADAFITNDYYESDVAWMDLEGNLIDPTIGPYEVYEDKLMGYKAAFEAFITIRDIEESRKLEEFGSYLPELEMNLPIPEEHKNTKRGLASPTSVAAEVFTAGDTKAGIQTIAFNLPNDERVREAKGSKKVMLKNVIRAKFEKILRPIGDVVLEGDLLEFLDFDSYFYETYMHEMAHGLGPGRIVVEGRETTVNKELKEHYSVIEEAKADIVGLMDVFYFQDRGMLTNDIQEALTTFLAGIFRSIRFGVSEAHGLANLIELNYLIEKGHISFDTSSSKYSIDFYTARDGVTELARDLLMLEAIGDYEGTIEFIERYGKLTEDTKRVLNNLTEIPVDIKPVYSLE